MTKFLYGTEALAYAKCRGYVLTLGSRRIDVEEAERLAQTLPTMPLRGGVVEARGRTMWAIAAGAAMFMLWRRLLEVRETEARFDAWMEREETALAALRALDSLPRTWLALALLAVLSGCGEPFAAPLFSEPESGGQGDAVAGDADVDRRPVDAADARIGDSATGSSDSDAPGDAVPGAESGPPDSGSPDVAVDGAACAACPTACADAGFSHWVCGWSPGEPECSCSL